MDDELQALYDQLEHEAWLEGYDAGYHAKPTLAPAAMGFSRERRAFIAGRQCGEDQRNRELAIERDREHADD